MEGLAAQHQAFSGPSFTWTTFITLKGDLESGEIVRIHAGPGPEFQLSPADKSGAKYHVFAGRGYIWNNDRADTARLIQDGGILDEVGYRSAPPEGSGDAKRKLTHSVFQS